MIFYTITIFILKFELLAHKCRTAKQRKYDKQIFTDCAVSRTMETCNFNFKLLQKFSAVSLFFVLYLYLQKNMDFKLINEIPSKPQLMDANQIFVLLFEFKIALCFNCYKCIPHFVSLADIGTLINEFWWVDLLLVNKCHGQLLP